MSKASKHGVPSMGHAHTANGLPYWVATGVFVAGGLLAWSVGALVSRFPDVARWAFSMVDSVLSVQRLGVPAGGPNIIGYRLAESLPPALGHLSVACFGLAVFVVLLGWIRRQGTFWIQRPHLALGLMLLAVFSVSVMVRLPNLGRPLAARHEMVTANALTALAIWEKAGIQNHGFVPAMTYAGHANRSIRNNCGVFDQDMECYYVSYPPFGHIWPYGVFWATGVSSGVMPLHVFNLALNFVSAIFVFLTVGHLSRKVAGRLLPTAAVAAFVAYLCFPVTLWFQQNTYFSEMAAQPLFIMTVYAFLLTADRQRVRARVPAILLFFCLFLLAYTEWLGVFMAAALFAWALFQPHFRRRYLLMAIFFGASFLAVTLTIWQYGRVLGFVPLTDAWMSNYLYRGGLDAKDASLFFSILDYRSWIRILFHYFRSYGPALVFLGIFAYLSRSVLVAWWRRRAVRIAMFALLVPPLLHHIFLFQYTAVHEYSPLKTAPFLAVVIGFMVQAASNKFGLFGSARGKHVLLASVLASLTVVACIGVYYLDTQATDSLSRKWGDIIAEKATDSEAVFIDAVGPSGQKRTSGDGKLIYYAKRNVVDWHGKRAALERMNRVGVEKGVVFHFIAGNSDYFRIERFSAD